MRRPVILAIVVVAIAVVSGAVAIGVLMSNEPAQASTRFVASLGGGEEVPPVTTSASGEATFTLSADGTTMTFRLVVSNISDAVASHIHLAQPGANGPVAVPLFSGTPAGMFSGVLAEGTITAAQLAGPLAGKSLSALIAETDANNAYVNVHTVAHPPGEIRGQLRRSAP